MADDIILLKNVSKSFNLKKLDFDDQKFKKTLIPVIDDISLTIQRGQMIGLVGKNGSGKTTLLRIISGILSPDMGTVEIRGNIGPLLQIEIGRASCRERV